MNVYSRIFITLMMLNGLVEPTAEAAITATLELPKLQSSLQKELFLASGTTDKDEEVTIDDPDEQLTIDDTEEQKVLEDPDEAETTGDDEEEVGISDSGEEDTIDDPEEKSNF
jgi:hypothetical protein